jgi:hypothetical protein
MVININAAMQMTDDNADNTAITQTTDYNAG